MSKGVDEAHLVGPCEQTIVSSLHTAHGTAALLWSVLVEGIHSWLPSGKYLESCHTDGKS